MYENELCTIEIKENKSRSVTPSPTARYRDIILDISRRFGRRSHDGLHYGGEDDSGNSSDTSSWNQIHKSQCKSSLELYSDSSENYSSSDDSDKTDILSKRLYRRSLSMVRSALSDLSISPRPTSSQSTTPSKKSSSDKKEKKSQQKILRQPVSYTYLKGMSGLPTQRVPTSNVCCQYACRRRFIV